MKRRRKYTAYYRYFLSYSILILLFFTLTLPIVFNYINLAGKNIVGEYQSQIDRNAAAVEEELKTLTSLFRRLVEADGIEGTLVQSQQDKIDYLEIRRTQEIFSDLQRAYPLITDYTLIGKNGLIYFNFRSFDNRPFFREIFDRDFFRVEGTGSLEEFFEKRGKDTGYARVASCDWGSYPALLCRAKLLSVYSFGSQETATVYFSLNLEDLTAFIVPDAIADDVFFAFYQDGEQEVYTNLPDDANREAFVAFKTQMPTAGGGLVFFYPEEMIVSNMQALVNILWLNIAAALSTGLLLAVYFSWRAHRPVRRLTQLVQEAAKTQRAAGDNELAYVAAEFGKLHSMLRENGQLLEEQKKMLRRSALESAVFGHIHTASSQGYFEELMPDFPRSYQMALFAVDAPRTMDVALSQQFLLEKQIQEFFAAEYVLSLSPGHLLLIMPVRTGESLRSSLEIFCRTMGNTVSKIQAALSNVHKGMLELNEAYLELLHIFRLCDQENGQVFELSDMGVSQPSGFDYHVLQYLYQAILYGEREEIAIQFNRLRMMADQGQLRDSDQSENWLSIRQFLLSVLLRIKREHNSRLYEVTVPAFNGNQPLEEYFHAAEVCAGEMAARFNDENRNQLQKNLQETVMTYINENLRNPSFYLKTVTDQFRISERNVQAIVHESTGTSFSEYVEKQRLCLARQLLKDTELSVAEIAEQVGFTAYNTFYKAFKRGYDQSPTEFRAVLRKEAEKKAGS